MASRVVPRARGAQSDARLASAVPRARDAAARENGGLGSLEHRPAGRASARFSAFGPGQLPPKLPRRPSHGASTGPKPTVLRCSRSQSGDIAGAAKLTIFATRDL